jgi:NitT/TauT family transport system substrate-binding protein
MRQRFLGAAAIFIIAATVAARAEVSEVRIPTGAGGLGFLPLLIMERNGLIEKESSAAGVPVKVSWINIGGPTAVNDALLSNSVDFIAAGPPGFLTIWSKTIGSLGVKGVAALSSLPMYLNTRDPELKSIDDIKEPNKIAMNAIKVSAPAIFLQMYAEKKFGKSDAFHFDRYAVPMSHADGTIAMLSGSKDVQTHFTSPPFHQRERKDPSIRTVLTSNQIVGGPMTFTMLSTTGKFRTSNPKVYSAVLAALRDAISIIHDDKNKAANIYLETPGNGGPSVDDIVTILSDPDTVFTTRPERMMQFSDFMCGIGTIKICPKAWTDLFFPEIYPDGGS